MTSQTRSASQRKGTEPISVPISPNHTRYKAGSLTTRAHPIKPRRGQGLAYTAQLHATGRPERQLPRL